VIWTAEVVKVKMLVKVVRAAVTARVAVSATRLVEVTAAETCWREKTGSFLPHCPSAAPPRITTLQSFGSVLRAVTVCGSADLKNILMGVMVYI
jgi:hypothetical protein